MQKPLRSKQAASAALSLFHSVGRHLRSGAIVSLNRPRYRVARKDSRSSGAAVPRYRSGAIASTDRPRTSTRWLSRETSGADQPAVGGLPACAIAQRQASAIAPADDCFRPGSATELATALATQESPMLAGRCRCLPLRLPSTRRPCTLKLGHTVVSDTGGGDGIAGGSFDMCGRHRALAFDSQLLPRELTLATGSRSAGRPPDAQPVPRHRRLAGRQQRRRIRRSQSPSRERPLRYTGAIAFDGHAIVRRCRSA
jgi:hypothetical protein